MTLDFHYNIREAFGEDREDFFYQLVDKVTGSGYTLQKAMEYIFQQCLASGFDASFLEANKEDMEKVVAHSLEW